MAFEAFYAATEGQPPSSLALAAVKAIENPGGRALDVGSGAGRDAAYFAEQGFETEAIDPNPLAAVPEGSGISFRHEAAETFERPAGTYRLVLCNKVLPFITSPGGIEGVLAKISATLAPDGVAAFSLFGERDGWAGRPGVRVLASDEASTVIVAAKLHVLQRWEEEFEMAAAGANTPKHWHIVRYLAAREV